jgi:NADH dehydrogenase [ubiquinone] 1 alpha subcomplex assembly factor 6
VKGETTAAVPTLAKAGLSAVGALVRRHDRDRYQTALFAPAARREGLFALYAFNYEIARVRESVRQPMLGQIRLQWWREVIDAAFAGRPARRHEVVQPLAATIREFDLSREHFDRMIEARERDLVADEPPVDLAALESYAEGTSVALILLALAVLDANQAAAAEEPISDRLHLACNAAGPSTRAQEAAVHVGIAYALAGLLRAMPFHARVDRRYIPHEIAARVGLDPADYAGLRDTPGLRRVTAEIAEAANRHLQAARRLRSAVPRTAYPALLPAIVAERFLARLRRAGFNPFAPELLTPDPLQSWRLAWAMLVGRF